VEVHAPFVSIGTERFPYYTRRTKDFNPFVLKFAKSALFGSQEMHKILQIRQKTRCSTQYSEVWTIHTWL